MYQRPEGGVMCDLIPYTAQYWLRLAICRAIFKYHYIRLDQIEREDLSVEITYTLGEAGIGFYHDFRQRYSDSKINETGIPQHILNRINKSLMSTRTPRAKEYLYKQDEELTLLTDKFESMYIDNQGKLVINPPNGSPEYTSLWNSVY